MTLEDPPGPALEELATEARDPGHHRVGGGGLVEPLGSGAGGALEELDPQAQRRRVGTRTRPALGGGGAVALELEPVGLGAVAARAGELVVDHLHRVVALDQQVDLALDVDHQPRVPLGGEEKRHLPAHRPRGQGPEPGAVARGEEALGRVDELGLPDGVDPGHRGDGLEVGAAPGGEGVEVGVLEEGVDQGPPAPGVAHRAWAVGVGHRVLEGDARPGVLLEAEEERRPVAPGALVEGLERGHREEHPAHRELGERRHPGHRRRGLGRGVERHPGLGIGEDRRGAEGLEGPAGDAGAGVEGGVAEAPLAGLGDGRRLAGEEDPPLGPGQRHVEEPRPLGGLPVVGALLRLVEAPGGDQGAVGARGLEAGPEVGVEAEGIAVAPGLAGQAPQRHHRELEPLGLVDGEHPHRLAPGLLDHRRGLLPDLPRPLDPVGELPGEGLEIPTAGGLPGPGEGDDLVDVGDLLGPVGEGRHQRPVAGLPEQGLEGAGGADPVAVARQHPVEGGEAGEGRGVGIGEARGQRDPAPEPPVVEAPAPRLGEDGEARVREGQKRRAEDRSEGHGVARVDQEGQGPGEVADLLGVVEAPALDHVEGQPGAGQLLGPGGEVGEHREEDGDLAVAGAVAALAVAAELGDAPGDHPRLAHRRGETRVGAAVEELHRR